MSVYGLSDDERYILSGFPDDVSLTESERIKKLKRYLYTLQLPTRKSIDQIAADWGQEKGFDQGTYMGGKRSGRKHKHTKKTRRNKSKNKKRKMTRSKK